MPSFNSIVAFSAVMAASSVYASPVALVPRAAICGTTPSGSGSQTPLSSPTGITTADACLAQCNAATSCLSFVFGLVNGVDECMLYSVAASALPATNTNLVAYDKACTGVPAVVPTTANPQGLAVAATTSNTETGTTTTGNNNNGAASNNGAKQNRDVDIVARAICGAAPTGPALKAGGASPTQTIQATTLAECKTKCVAAGTESCQSYEFGNNQCMLFAVAASKIPSSNNGQAYDINGC